MSAAPGTFRALGRALVQQCRMMQSDATAIQLEASPFGLAALSLTISVGAVLDITLGVMLFRLKDDPYGGLTAYAFSHIAAGACVILSTLY